MTKFHRLLLKAAIKEEIKSKALIMQASKLKNYKNFNVKRRQTNSKGRITSNQKRNILKMQNVDALTMYFFVCSKPMTYGKKFQSQENSTTSINLLMQHVLKLKKIYL